MSLCFNVTDDLCYAPGSQMSQEVTKPDWVLYFSPWCWWERWPITSFTAVGEDLDVSRIESWEIPKPEYGLRPTHPSPVSPLSPHHLHIIGSAVSEG